MVMKIIRTKTFSKDFARVGGTSEDYEALVTELIENPESGDRIQGLKGVRKIRFAFKNRNIGKSGGGRAIYLAMVMQETIILLKAYAKNEKTDLSARQRKEILRFLEEFDHA
jgi:hypothetical protein